MNPDTAYKREMDGSRCGGDVARGLVTIASGSKTSIGEEV